MNDKQKARRERRRRVMPGFPKTEKFQSLQEVREYLSHPKITCLLCGKQYRALGLHLKSIHDVTPDEYREMYGLPYRRGLTSEPTHTLKSAVGKRLFHDGVLLANVDTEAARQLAQEAAKHKRTSYVHRLHTASRNRETAHKRRGLYAFSRSKYIALLRAEHTPVEAAQMLETNTSAVRRERNKNSRFERAFHAAISAQSYATQARGQWLGERFERDCRRLFDAGYSDHEIAEKLGVTAMTCNNKTKPWRAASA